MQLLDPVDQCIPVHIELPRSLRHVEVIVKELLHGRQDLVIQIVWNVIPKDLFHENAAQIDRKLVDQTPYSKSVVGADRLLHIKDHAHIARHFRLLVGF